MKMRHPGKVTWQSLTVRKTSSCANKLNHHVVLKELKEMLQTKKEGRGTNSAPPWGC